MASECRDVQYVGTIRCRIQCKRYKGIDRSFARTRVVVNVQFGGEEQSQEEEAE